MVSKRLVGNIYCFSNYIENDFESSIISFKGSSSLNPI